VFGTLDWINEFSQHQAGKKLYIIEIEKDCVESLYYELKDSFRFDFYLKSQTKKRSNIISQRVKSLLS